MPIAAPSRKAKGIGHRKDVFINDVLNESAVVECFGWRGRSLDSMTPGSKLNLHHQPSKPSELG